MSFNCDLCGYQNNEIQSGGQVQDQGIKFKVKIQSSEDLCRQIVKSDYATLTVPEIELEIPPNSQKGGEKKQKPRAVFLCKCLIRKNLNIKLSKCLKLKNMFIHSARETS